MNTTDTTARCCRKFRQPRKFQAAICIVFIVIPNCIHAAQRHDFRGDVRRWRFSKDDNKFGEDVHKHLYMDRCTECKYDYYQYPNGYIKRVTKSCSNPECQDGHIPKANAAPSPTGASSQSLIFKICSTPNLKMLHQSPTAKPEDASPPTITEVSEADTEASDSEEPSPTRNGSQNAKTPAGPKPDAGKFIAFRGKASETRHRTGLLDRFKKPLTTPGEVSPSKSGRRKGLRFRNRHLKTLTTPGEMSPSKSGRDCRTMRSSQIR